MEPEFPSILGLYIDVPTFSSFFEKYHFLVYNGFALFIAASELNDKTYYHSVELIYFSANKTFWRLGALEPKWSIITNGTKISSNHGIIWKIEVPEEETRYVAQVGTQSI